MDFMLPLNAIRSWKATCSNSPPTHSMDDCLGSAGKGLNVLFLIFVCDNNFGLILTHMEPFQRSQTLKSDYLTASDPRILASVIILSLGL